MLDASCSRLAPGPLHPSPPLPPPTHPPPREAVYSAMLEVPRSLLVPAPYKREAHIDTPIRLEEQDVNISAPHM